MSAYAKLRRRRQIFVDAYVRLGVGSDAAIAAGFGPKRPDVAASKMLANPEVKAAIIERKQQAIEKAGVREVRVLEELCRLAFFNPQDLVDENGELLPLNKLKPEVAAALQGVEVEDQYAGSGTDRHLVSRKHKYRQPAKSEALKTLLTYLKVMPQPTLELPSGATLEGRVEITDTEKARRIAFILTMGLRAKATTPLSALPEDGGA